MIVGDFRGYDQERVLYPAALIRALDYLKEADWSKLENGRYDIDGDRIFVNVGDGTTAHASQRKAERHIRYTDV
ncbi:hypothetical protein GCM10010911_06850 [Paenibacillus nasutitermitis]|uniref:Uncharacterized protein n=1 Tax=Paenibacillus nasutitermitis TaxID=1652958 RepID=A0A916YMQ1_9BACL|nr:hypothetical protein GCM10010911_06850 [Paenibacillus nasutitermitis]